MKEIPEVVWDIIDLSENQPTIVYPEAINLPDILLENDGSIAIRIAQNITLLERIKEPVIATSANISGNPAPIYLEQVSNEILSEVDFILNLPQNKIGQKPSSIIKLKTNGEIQIIRK